MTEFKWWQQAVIYQIYPRSFADGNGDGIGDLQGMISKLDYLQSLGVDAIWLSPHFPSPQIDWGYDISDYYGVAPEYGTLDEFKQFLDGLHQRGMRLILDLVLNHTSDQHPWFIESRSSKDNPKRDWYVWSKGKNNGPPNNWYSAFGGSGWDLDPLTGEYYYHFFFKEQPDLNWRNPEVKAAMFDVVRYWLDMGVDGFRLDAIGTIFEVPELPDQSSKITLDELYRIDRLAKSPLEQDAARKIWDAMFLHQHDLPEVHDLMKELRAVVDEYPDRVLIGETDDIAFYGNGQDELHLNFNFPLMRTDRITPDWVRKNQAERLKALPQGAWPCNTIGNHDSRRMFSAFGDGKHNREIARLNLALMVTLWGTPSLYNGEEIGMSDYIVNDPKYYRDPLCSRAYQLEMDLMGTPSEEAARYAARNGRDKCRTPMQWQNEPNGGFSPAGVETWLPVNPNYASGVNVQDQEASHSSLLHDYRRILAARKANPALILGDYQEINRDSKAALTFLRTTAEQTCLVVLNYSDQPQTLSLELVCKGLKEIYSSRTRKPEENQPDKFVVGPLEVVFAEVIT